MRTRSCIDTDWKFHLGEDLNACNANYDHSGWRTLNVPHDWSVEATPHPDSPTKAGGGFFPGGIGWYRKELAIPEDLGDNRVILEFDGVYMNSDVWCNNWFCGNRPYGYSSFAYDITPHVKPGETAVIAVRVDNSRQQNSRWYSGSGLYRHVWMTIAAPVRVDQWGTFVTTPEVGEQAARVACSTTVINETDTDCAIELTTTLIDAAGTQVAETKTNGTVDASEKTELAASFIIDNPSLWSPESPALYTLKTTVSSEGTVLDCYETPCGIRSVTFDANRGMFLNGKSIKMKGVNEHHDAGCVGAAVPDDMIRRRFKILKDMGCNAIRVAHNPASPTFLDLCDEMGFLVVEDAFDEWRRGKKPYGYQMYWDQWWERDLVDMIRRDRNHPSVVLWSVGNEIVEVREGMPEGLPIMDALRDVCHREDPSRLMTCGCCATRKTLAGGYGPKMDVVGYNGGGGSCFDYEKDHATYPEMIMFASEVPHSLQTRGVYRTQSWYRDVKGNNSNVERLVVPDYTDEEVFTDFDTHYQSSYDNAMVRISAIDSWRLTRDLDFMCGEFRWTGFDYIGECYRWPAKSWNFGIIDLCGFPKDTYYFYQSEWTDEPMVHILPHWTWPGLEGKTIPVIAYSNCDEVELFQDGVSLGKQAMDTDAMHVRWDVDYRAGSIKAVGLNNNEAVAECCHETAGEPTALNVTCDEDSVRADGTGIAHVCVTVVDGQGRFVPWANKELTVAVSGAGTLIGLENGDPIDSTNYKINTRATFNGMALAIIQADKTPGKLTVSVSAEGLQTDTIEILAN